MALIKDGIVYRTYEEQVQHLTDKHIEQLTINENVSRELQELGVAANLGGYNLVRFGFVKAGTFYHYQLGTQTPQIDIDIDYGDYFEITSGNSLDIPAYGYIINDDDAPRVNIVFGGDFIQNYTKLIFINVTKKQTQSLDVYNFEQFDGTSLNDYNANDRKKQLFNVLQDLTYNTRTQYVSFDLNNDGNYSFVFIGAVPNGKDGASTYVTNGKDVQEIIEKIKLGDIIEFGNNNTTSLVNPSAVIGDLYEYTGNNNFVYKGNIRGPVGAKGETGATGEQGIQGVDGIQGIQGETGPQGEPGRDGIGIIPHSGILNSPSELPPFSSVELGEGYVVLNTSGATVAYDLYFKGRDGTDWSFIPNWGGIKGDKGDKGDTGSQGIQGVQGIQGQKGVDGGVSTKITITRTDDDGSTLNIFINGGNYTLGIGESRTFDYILGSPIFLRCYNSAEVSVKNNGYICQGFGFMTNSNGELKFYAGSDYILGDNNILFVFEENAEITVRASTD